MQLDSFEGLSSYKKAVSHIQTAWPEFVSKRSARLEQMHRHGIAAERVAENIIEDLFTIVLDWSLSDINNQIGYADILISDNGIKRLVIEAKRPAALAWNRNAVERALDQARRYAAEQRVQAVAVSDGFMFYAADVVAGGLRDRVFASLESPLPDQSLWWLSVHGIYRERTDGAGAGPNLLPKASSVTQADLFESAAEPTLLHPKYRVPVECFAYVGNASDTATWKLPYKHANGELDVKRLPKAIQAILSNYRGAKVRTVPESAIPDVLVRLARAAASLGRMPFQCGEAASAYCQLESALRQLERLDEVREG